MNRKNEDRCQKILLVEDDMMIVAGWIRRLCGAKLDEVPGILKLVQGSQTELLILGDKNRQLHVTGGAAVALQAAQSHIYAAAFIDGSLVGGSGYPAMLHIARNSPSTSLNIISGTKNIFVEALQKDGIDTVARKVSGQLQEAFKSFNENEAIFRAIWGPVPPSGGYQLKPIVPAP